jgi:RNA polymerase sigma-70 factor (sigma-E family)
MMRVGVESVRIEGTRLAELYRAYAADGVRIAYLITGDRALAEDLTHEAFLRLAGRLLHFRDPGGFQSYLRRTIVNLTNAYFRRKKVERRYLERRTGEVEQGWEEPDVATRETLRAALFALPVRHRTAIVLRFYEDLSEAQTAEIMRCRPGTVKSLVSRGVDRLRPLMAGD